MTERTYTIRDWNCATQQYDPPREVTLAQFLAENEAKKAAALAIYRANVAKLRGQS